VLAHHACQPLSDLAEQLVAGGVAERVVDVLEAVEIDEEKRAALPLLISASERRFSVRSVPMPLKPRNRP
jgi:hypothetical protein